MYESKVVSYNQIKQIISGFVYNYLGKMRHTYIKESWFSEYNARKKTFAVSFTLQEVRLNIRYEITFNIEDLQSASLKFVKHKIGKNGVAEESEVLKKDDFWVVFPAEGRKTNIYPCFIQKGKCINGSTEYYKYILEKQQKRKKKRQAGYQGFIDTMQETVLDAYKERGEI